MLRIKGQRFSHLLFQATPFLFLFATSYGQSLGDVARENREKKAELASPAPKVITNADLPKNQDAADDETQPSQGSPVSATRPAVRKATAKRPMDARAAEQWRRQILAQKRTVANLERRLAVLKASISFVDASANARGEVFNRRQALQQQREARLQEQLEEQRSELEEMQESARRAGMHTAVYDP
jgi:ATP-dependent Lon protease